MNLEKLIQEPMSKYHESQALSASGMKLLLRSPRHYHARYPDGVMKDDVEETDAQALGSLLHAAVLEPGSVMDKLVEIPKFEGIGMKQRKIDWYAKTLDERPEAILVKRDDFENLRRMIDSVLEDELACAILRNAIVERSIYFDFIDSDGVKIPCRARPDIIREDATLCDIKTTKCGEKEVFMADAWRRLYHLQAAVQWRAIEVGVGTRPRDHSWIVVENIEPWCCSVFIIPDDLLEAGTLQMQKAIARLREAKAVGRWRGYQDTVMREPDIACRPKWAELE